MTIEEISRHFNVKKKWLSPCIIVKIQSGKPTEYLPGYRVKNTSLVINVFAKQFISIVKTSILEVKAIPVEIARKGNNTFVFKAVGEDIPDVYVDKGYLAQIYHYQWYSPELEKEIILS